MSTQVPYNTTRWRELPRSGSCEVGRLLGTECSDDLHLHHVHPLAAGGDPFGPTVLICSKHHPSLEALARRVYNEPERKQCPHPPGAHRYPGSREACERRLNGFPD